MPKDDHNPNGKTPKQNLPEELNFERHLYQCKRCKRDFENVLVEEIENLTQLRVGSLLLVKIEATCMHCGCVHHWDMHKKDLEKMTATYGELLKQNSSYNPE